MIFILFYIIFLNIQGRFEILSLSGSFLLSENGGQRSRTGGLSVSLSGPDGRVLGGGVAGLLTAASPVQVRFVLFASRFSAVGGTLLKINLRLYHFANYVIYQ